MATKKIVEKIEVIPAINESKWVMLGWALLLLGGLAHMLPAQMASFLQWSVYGVTVQTAVGVVSVVLALYFLLGND